MKLNRNPTIDGEESTCYSVDPVLKCMKDCTPVEKASVKVGFHCFPKGTVFFSLCVSHTAGAVRALKRTKHSRAMHRPVLLWLLSELPFLIPLLFAITADSADQLKARLGDGR